MTFSTTSFCTRLVNSTSLAVNKNILPLDLGVFKFVSFTEISPRGAINVIAVGSSRVNALILSVLIVII